MCQGRRQHCRGAQAVSLGPDWSENHSDVGVETVELPQLQPSYSCLDKVFDMPVVCNDRCPWCRGCSAVMDVLRSVIMQRQVGVSPTVEVPQIQFIAGVSGHSCCATETGTQLSAGYSGDEWFFGLFHVIFRAPPVRLELSARFRRRVLCHRWAPLHNSSDSVDIDIVPSWSRLKQQQ